MNNPIDHRGPNIHSHLVLLHQISQALSIINIIYQRSTLLLDKQTSDEQFLAHARNHPSKPTNAPVSKKPTTPGPQVSAFTRAGDGVASAPLYCVTEEDRPEVPAGIKAVASSATSIIVSWQPPLRSNGIITSYSVNVRSVGPEGKWYRRALQPHETSYLAENLHKKNQYEFNIAAVTSVGDGPRTPSIVVSPSSEGEVFFATSPSLCDSLGF